MSQERREDDANEWGKAGEGVISQLTRASEVVELQVPDWPPPPPPQQAEGSSAEDESSSTEGESGSAGGESSVGQGKKDHAPPIPPKPTAPVPRRPLRRVPKMEAPPIPDRALRPDRAGEKKRRLRVAHLRTLLKDETKYLSQIDELLNVFRKELWEAGVLKEVHRDDIFGDLEEIAGTHRQLVENLEKAFEVADREDFAEAHIGDVFLPLLPYMRQYSGFFERCAKGNEEIIELLKKPKFKKKMKELEERLEKRKIANKSVGLVFTAKRNLMIRKVGLYRLVFQDIQRVTPETHRDYEALGRLIQEAGKIQKKLNDLQMRARPPEEAAHVRGNRMDIGVSSEKSHHWKEWQGMPPKWNANNALFCDGCGKLIEGNGFQCSDCAFICHDGCQRELGCIPSSDPTLLEAARVAIDEVSRVAHIETPPCRKFELEQSMESAVGNANKTLVLFNDGLSILERVDKEVVSKRFLVVQKKHKQLDHVFSLAFIRWRSSITGRVCTPLKVNDTCIALVAPRTGAVHYLVFSSPALCEQWREAIERTSDTWRQEHPLEVEEGRSSEDDVEIEDLHPSNELPLSDMDVFVENIRFVRLDPDVDDLTLVFTINVETEKGSFKLNKVGLDLQTLHVAMAKYYSTNELPLLPNVTDFEPYQVDDLDFQTKVFTAISRFINALLHLPRVRDNDGNYTVCPGTLTCVRSFFTKNSVSENTLEDPSLAVEQERKLARSMNKSIGMVRLDESIDRAPMRFLQSMDEDAAEPSSEPDVDYAIVKCNFPYEDAQSSGSVLKVTKGERVEIVSDTFNREWALVKQAGGGVGLVPTDILARII